MMLAPAEFVECHLPLDCAQTKIGHEILMAPVRFVMIAIRFTMIVVIFTMTD